MKVPKFFRRIAAFTLDYLLIAAYLIVLSVASLILAFGPLELELQAFLSSPARMDLVAFVTTILPVMSYFTLLESSEGGATWGKRRMSLRVVNLDGSRLSTGRALMRSLVKFLPWQVSHTCLFHIPGWPLAIEEPPTWVTVGFILVWVLIGIYIVALAVNPFGRTPYDWIAGSRVVVYVAGA